MEGGGEEKVIYTDSQHLECIIRGLGVLGGGFGDATLQRSWQYFFCSPYFKGFLTADDPGRLQSWSAGEGGGWLPFIIQHLTVSAREGLCYQEIQSKYRGVSRAGLRGNAAGTLDQQRHIHVALLQETASEFCLED